MATFKVTKTSTVADFKAWFKNEFNGTLHVYNGRSQASNSANLVGLGATPKTLKCRASRTVGSFIKLVKDTLNLKVNVFTSTNWVSVLYPVTLGNIKNIPPYSKLAGQKQLQGYKRQQSKLTKDVANDIRVFLKNHVNLIVNEMELRMWIANTLLCSKKYDEIYLEYYLSKNVLNIQPWSTNVYIDIVVRKGEEYLPIEIKFKTHKLGIFTDRFGDGNNHAIEIFRTQDAVDLGQYHFWKDVKRLEEIKANFNNVKNGLVLFLTNEPKYLVPVPKTNINANLGVENGLHGMDKHWNVANGQSKVAASHPGFNLSNNYIIEWENAIFVGSNFNFVLLTI